MKTRKNLPPRYRGGRFLFVLSDLGPLILVVYDPALVDQLDLLSAELKTAQAIIVRNRTQVRGDLLTWTKRLKAVGRLGVMGYRAIGRLT